MRITRYLLFLGLVALIAVVLAQNPVTRTATSSYPSDGTAQFSSGKLTSSSGVAKIAETILGSDSGSVTFSSIPGTYRNLRIELKARSTRSGGADHVHVRFNADTGNNYSWVLNYTAGSTPAGDSAFATSSLRLGGMTASSGPASTGGGDVIDILDYARTTMTKNGLGHMFRMESASTGYVIVYGGNWQSTAAITSITLLPDPGGAANFVSGSVFTLYGLN